MATCLIGMGSNLGDRTAALERAIELLAGHAGNQVLARSRWFDTVPIGGPSGQGNFVNAALRLESTLSPAALLELLRDVEARVGRQRRERWAARVVDLDLLLYDAAVIRSEFVEVPHPRLAFRRFVLEPAAEVGGDLLHPVFGVTIGWLLDRLNTAANYVALAGAKDADTTQLAIQLAERTGASLILNPAADIVTGDPLRRELAVVRRRTALLSPLLAAARPPAECNGAVSDFWLGQSLIQTDIWPDAATAECEAAVANAWREVPRPKLLVLIGGREPASDGDRLPRLRQAAIDWRECPFLELDGRDREWMLTELLAAMAAMK